MDKCVSMKLLLLFAIGTAVILNVESCECEDKDLGCFNRLSVFSTLIKPYCLDVVDAKYGLYTRHNRETPIFITRDSQLPNEFDPRKRTIIVVHGWRTTFAEQWMHDIRRALLEAEDCNVIILGWGGGANTYLFWKSYKRSAATTRLVGAELALIIDKLKAASTVRSNVWCIGHSLGAHVCGYAGERTILDRLTGLDPADPIFRDQDVIRRLDPNDADFVDVIHTDAQQYWGGPLGTPNAVGDADYYPNGIAVQPACYWKNGRSLSQIQDAGARTERVLEKRRSMCSHSMAYYYFLESVKTPECFKVTQRCTPKDRRPSNCVDCADCGYMGYKADALIGRRPPMGIFQLIPTHTKPYCNN